MKQGTGNRQMGDQKMEPRPRVANPGGADGLGQAMGNHSDHKTFTPRITPLYGDRGYEAPPIRNTSNPKGSQGKY